MFENTQKPRQNFPSQTSQQPQSAQDMDLPPQQNMRQTFVQQSQTRMVPEDMFAETGDVHPRTSPAPASQQNSAPLQNPPLRAQGVPQLSQYGPTATPSGGAGFGGGTAAPVPQATSGTPPTPPRIPPNPFVPVQPGGESSASVAGSKALKRSQKIILVLVGVFVVGVLLAGGFFLYIYIQKRASSSIPIDDATLNTVRNQALQNANASGGTVNTNTNRSGVTVNTNTAATNGNQNVNRSSQNANQNVNANELVNAFLNQNTAVDTNVATNTNSVTNTSNKNTNVSSTNRPANTNTAPSPISDADNDGLLYEDEMKYGTDPENPDSDGDSYLDGEEVENGYDPLGPGKLAPAK